MHEIVYNYLNNFMQNKEKRRKMISIMILLSILVSICVFWQLKLTGITMTDEAFCGYQEHSHTESCKELVLKCGLDESEGHSHSVDAGCFTETSVLICGQEESEDAIICGLEEHIHNENCHTVQINLICQLQENEEHLHSVEAGCFENVEVLSCSITEHVHEEECYSRGHVHTSECSKLVQNINCTIEEKDAHVHNEFCYEEKNACTLEEHTHTVTCYSNRNAIETAAQWESTLPARQGIWSRDVAAIALSQVGYQENQQNFEVAQDGITKQYYTRYGAWYGNPYGDWNAMFAAFCLHYAGVPTSVVPVNSGAHAMMVSSMNTGILKNDPAFVPERGDLVYLDRNGDQSADSVGIIVEKNHHMIQVIEGDCNNTVASNAWDISDGRILGYVDLNQFNPKESFVETKTEESLIIKGENQELANEGTEIEDMLDVEEEPITFAGDSENNISISFVIDNAIYTSDTASGNTHLTVTPAYAEAFPAVSGLTYTKWTSSVYKVTGTGTMLEASIPAGSALSENEISLPKLSTVNIGSSNAVTYESTYSWITKDGRICNANTIFTEDTVLYLYLYETAQTYSLNFVCADDDCGSHSVTNVVGGYANATFTLGQSISDSYIPTAEDVNAKYDSQYCSHGYQHGETFVRWYLKDTDGNKVDFYAGTVLEEKYLDPNATRTIKVYAEWKTLEVTVTPTPTVVPEENKVTATFIYNGETVDIYELSVNAALGTLPEAPEYAGAEETYEFLGWQYTDENGAAVFANENTIIQTDTNYIAVFGEPDYFYIELHDIDYEGNEPEFFLELSALQDVTLAEAMDETYLEDGVPAAECIWYMFDENGEKVLVNLDTPVTSDLVLYTYSYRLVLTLTNESEVSVMSIVDVTENADGSLSLEMIAREGETLKASDFVINGKDYTLYTWVDENGNTIDVQALLENGLTENVSATSNGTMTGVQSSRSMNINFYVFVNGERAAAAGSNPVSVTVYKFSDSNRYYLSAAQLEMIYGKYGFTASQMTADSHLFPHTNTGSGTIWGDASVKEVNGMMFSPIVNAGDFSSADVYYLPKTVLTGGAGYTNYLTSDTFYTVTVEDITELVYPAGSLPEEQYILTGNSANITVENNGGEVEWICNGMQTETDASNIEIRSESDTTSVTIHSVTQPYVISPSGTYKINYDSSVDIVNVGAISKDSQVILGEVATVGGKTYYSESLQGQTTATVKSPSMQEVRTIASDSGDRKFIYYFQGWQVNGDNNKIIQPGEVLQLEEFGDGAVINLKAIWTPYDSTGHIQTVNFFVNKACEILDTSGSGFNSQNQNNFTESLYATEIYGTENVVYNGSNNAQLTASSSEENAYEVDNQIRNAVSTPISGVTLKDMPSDEVIMANIRNWILEDSSRTLQVGTETYDADDVDKINTNNFSVRWYVLKYEGNGGNHDGWHIDGILVQKAGKLTVTKQFYGNETAISTIKNSYQITASADGKVTHTLNLNAYSDNNTGGYTVYDENTNTYTWVIDVKQSTQYNIKESNYISASNIIEGQTMATLAEYLVINSPEASKTWTTYTDAGVNVTAYAYAVDTTYDKYQTVNLMNSYLATNSMIVRKVDKHSNIGLGNVSFILERKDSSDAYKEVALWKHGDTYFMYDPINEGVSAELVTDGMITGDAEGNLLLIGLKDSLYAGSYRLTEVEPPEGYSRINNPVLFEISADGEVTLSDLANASLTDDGLTLRIYNEPKTTQISIEKIWDNGEETLPVILELWRNGVKLENYSVTLDGTIDGSEHGMETSPWKCTWIDLPLFIDGDVAEYSIHESWIGLPSEGGASFDATADTDGYANYVVTKEPVHYTFDDGTSQDVPTRQKEDGTVEYATIANLAIHNSVFSNKVEFQKTDEAGNGLQGAEFTIYKDEACTQIAATVIADENGKVSITLKSGTYYVMKESKVPSGFMNNDEVYEIEISNTGTSIKDSEGNMISEIVNYKDQATVVVKKVNADGVVLKGAEFELYMQNSDGQWEKQIINGKTYYISDENGLITFNNLARGKYKLIEKHAPTGYYALTKDILFTIDKRIVSLDNTNSSWSLITPPNAEHNTIVVTNVAGAELPSTGGFGKLPYTLGGLLLMAGSLMYGYMMRRERERRRMK